jgi:hypothetical protein
MMVPFNLDDMRREMSLLVYWYNEFRPHQSLDSKTPQVVYSHSPPTPPIQVASNAELPDVKMAVSYFEGRKHLPVIGLKQAA